MSFDKSNDNTKADAVLGPDAHGQAAMLLVESLIHGLIARDVISAADAVEIVDIAIDVRIDEASDRNDATSDFRNSVEMLQAISSSLSRDVRAD